MANIRLSQRYAKALHELVIEMKKEDRVREDMHTLYNSVKNNRELAVMIKSPVIPGDQKLKTLQLIFKSVFDELTMQFIELMIRKGREKYLYGISEAYFQLDFAHRGITPVTITTAQKLSDAALQNIVNKLKETGVVEEVELSTKEDNQLIGGFVLQFHDKLLDASVSRKLEIFKTQFEENVYVKKF